MAILKRVAYDFGQSYQIQRSWRNHFTGNVASVKICISIWSVDCLANWYLRPAVLCCLFAQIVNLSQFRGITQKKHLCFLPFILRANSHSWVGIYRLNHKKFVFKWSMFLNGHSFPHFLLKTQSFDGLTLNGTHKKLNQPKMVVGNWMRSHCVVWSVSNPALVCSHTYLASSANESLWALTLECLKHINTYAAILA